MRYDKQRSKIFFPKSQFDFFPKMFKKLNFENFPGIEIKMFRRQKSKKFNVYNKKRMTETLLRKLSDKISEVYDLSLAKELTDIYVELTEQIREDDYKYFNLAKKLAKLEKEKDRIECDKEYFENFANELLENRK